MAKKKNKKKKQILTPGVKLFLVVLLIPASITMYFLVFLAWQELKTFSIFEKLLYKSELEEIQADFDLQIPEEYIPIYIAASEKYNVPWTLLAAHHRVETRFSSMKTLVSPVGAEGHLQFMPCTFVGWSHPTCSGKGKGEINENEKTDPAVIKKYGGYGIDANGDGIADPYDIEDAVYSAANYLSKAGVSEGKLKKAIFSYNHSDEYVEDILHYYKLYESVSDEIEYVVLAKREDDHIR